MAIITTANLKSHLGISDTNDDTTIGWAVDAANSAVVEYCGRDFDKTATVSASARVFDRRAANLVEVDDFWETTVLVVKTDDDNDGTYETTWTINTDYILEPLNGRRYGQTWPYETIRAVGSRTFPSLARPAIQVTAAWGWTAVPASVFEAALIKAARVWKRRKSPEGVLSGFAEFGPVRISRSEDPDVVDLLDPYRRRSVKFGIA